MSRKPYVRPKQQKPMTEEQRAVLEAWFGAALRFMESLPDGGTEAVRRRFEEHAERARQNRAGDHRGGAEEHGSH